MTETPQQEHRGVDTDHLRDYERLRRSQTDRKIAGVAGGLGRHLNIDPTIVRVILVVLCFFGGAGLVLYAAAWLVVPEEGSERGVIATSGAARNVILLGIAALAALLVLGGSWHGFGVPWICFVIAIVVFALLAGRDRRTHARGDSYAQPAEQRQYAGQAVNEPVPADGAVSADYPVPASPPPPVRPDRGPLLFGPTLALVAVALGVLGLVEATGHSVDAPAYPALALALIGAMLVVGAWVGRAGGLVLLGIVAALALAATSVTGVDVGNRQLRVDPTSATQVHGSYFLPAGRAYVDLTDVAQPAELDGRSIDIGSRAGTIVVVLPHDVRAQVDAEVTGPGDIVTPRRNESGFGTAIVETVNPAVDSPLLHLRLHTYAGHIEVRTR
ncbi:MAG TPA: PspC domain-containing protein [Nocardioidaceae bacterium]|nr:PspC domain-containing protein [Nocardioidaceae bacterium]